MRCLFIITATMTAQQLNHQYLLILSMLNFDHEVQLLFKADAFNQISKYPEQLKKWQALRLYGVPQFLQLTESKTSCHKELKTISHAAYAQLKNQADMLS